jgi:hypothetical protein
MIPAQITQLLEDMLGRWPHSDVSSGATIDRYTRDLAPVAAEHALAAVETIYRDGERFAPSGAAIVQRIADLALDAPDWGAVKVALVGARHAAPAAWECPLGRCDGRGLIVDEDTRTASPCACRDAMIAERRAGATLGHPLVAEFVRAIGPAELRDLQDRTAEAQVRTKWEAFVRATRRELTYQGVNPAGLPGVERVLASAASRARDNRGLNRPDTLKLIQGGEAA